METVAATTTRTNVNFNESLLISMIDKCPRLSRFIMAGFPFGHDQLIHQIADRLVSRSQDLSSETALNLIPSPVPDSASNTALTRPTTGGDGGGGGLKKLELTNLHLCELRAKPIQYLLDRCTPDLEELILTISFGSKAEAEYMGQENIATWADNNNSMDEDEDEDNDHFSSATPRSGQSHSVNGKSWKLRKLVLKGDLSGQGPLIWLPLLQKSRQLQILCVDVFQNLTMRQLAHTLGTCCPVVSEITLQCMTAPQQDSDIAELIQSSRSWRSLSMSFFHGFGPLSTLALIKHSYSLETLILEECDGLESRDIQTVLTTCSQLKTFRVMTSNGADFHSTMYLDAEDMMNSPWVCNGLVNLKLMIAGIPRPDLQTDQYGVRLTGPLHDGMMSGYEYHRTVYQQLGRLKNLRELWLGHDKQDLDDEENYYATEVIGQWKFIDPDEQFECLEFSLRSGLDELRGLKELRVLNVDRMNTRIGLSEVQWMVQQWPKLEKIIGLVIQGETRPKCVQWLYDNRPNIELPSVLGNFYTSR
ncbi:hypothetical protein BGZ76_006518 [Entomortierella beljakovae]|nr:hypothetical protein BGZ76_006518 [Entomortierella beljakovae]